MSNITKRTFFNALTCPTLGWLTHSCQYLGILSGEDENLADQFRKEQGIEIGQRARNIFPDGILVDAGDVQQALSKTNELIQNPSIFHIFEGTFQSGDYVTRADILERTESGWHLIEVKSSTNLKPELIDDLAYTAMILQQEGLVLDNISLYLISKDYRLGMTDQELFREEVCTEEVLSRIQEFQLQTHNISSVIQMATKPEPVLIFDCRKCSFLSECFDSWPQNSIFDLPRLSNKKFTQLRGLNILQIKDIPQDFELTAQQKMVRNSVQSESVQIGEHLKQELDKIQWPAHYLDFETVMTAIPLYADIAPYTQILTQYSIHTCPSVGKILQHTDYLADPEKDCRRELAEQLIQDLNGEGSILVYSSFEETVITGLIDLIPSLATGLNNLIQRMVDLEKIIRGNFYHPEFHGSTSIKKTLPALVNDLSYDNLEIQNGDNAVAAFAYMALGKYSREECETVRQNLLIYCEQDTLAMVKLHERLIHAQDHLD